MYLVKIDVLITQFINDIVFVDQWIMDTFQFSSQFLAVNNIIAYAMHVAHELN